MVSNMVLIKILRNQRRRQRNISDEGSSSNILQKSLEIKKEKDPEDIQKLCRVCLKEGDTPIYSEDGSGDMPEALNTFAGIDVQFDDDYPKYLCKKCYSLLQGAILLRKTAQQSEITLKRRAEEAMAENYKWMMDTGMPLDMDVKLESKQDKKFHCDSCDLDFDNFRRYNSHRKTAEHKNKKHTCHICNKTFSSSYIKKHISLHDMKPAYMCDICGKNFYIKVLFTRHRLIHFNHFPYKCAQCPYRGRFPESLKMHMRTHTGNRPYQCPECPNRFFTSKSNLGKHMHTHQSEPNFKCETCGRGFQTKGGIEKHFKIDHTGIKEHVCNICGKAFGYRKQMMKHQLYVHKREKFRSGRMPLYLQADRE